MDFSQNDVKKTDRNRLTRMKIGEAIVSLLDKTPLSEIKIATISKITGFSRMTFYHYYVSKEAALKDYLTEIIHLFKQETIKRHLDDKFKTVEHLAFTFTFFAHYDKLILKLESIGCYEYIVDCVNDFFQEEYRDNFDSPTDMHFYCGGIMNVFFHWLHDGQKESPRTLARSILRD